MNKICIFHNNCADGFGAAWVVHKAFPNQFEFHGATYGNAPPDVLGKDVVIVDFSYPKACLERMIAEAKSLLLIDHHKSAQADLTDFPEHTIFDMNHSGAMLTWKHFFKDIEPPQLLRHIEDRDLWRFDYYHTRQIHAALFSYPYDFEIWDRLMEDPIDALVAEGKAIERKHTKDLFEFLAQGTQRIVICGYNVPIVNLPYTFTSDACNIMAESEAFAVCYYDTPGWRNYGLRSKKGGVDVSEIAKVFGGGGHANAAGFRIRLDSPFPLGTGHDKEKSDGMERKNN